MINTNRGVTLVEAIVTLIIASVVFSGAFFLVSEYNEMVKENLTSQQLQQEGAIITEIVSRTVRNGKYITVHPEVTAPDEIKDSVKNIDIHYPGGNSTNLQIKDNTLMKDNIPIVAFSCQLSDKTCFKVYTNGSKIGVTILLEKTLREKTYTYTNIIEEVRCKNVNAL